MLNFLLFFTFPGICLAISWPKAGSSAQARGGVPQHWDQEKDFSIGSGILSGLTDQDAAALRINLDTLSAYSHKPDCFKSVAGKIQGRCSESDMDQDLRVSSAISMTLCEVSTATHYSIPFECRLFSFDAKSAQSSQHTQGDCVDALSRSTQLWSSFSGYMREIPQLCHAYRRFNDIDLARNLYHNATVEKLALIRFILAREKLAAQNADGMLQWLEEMKIFTTEMKTCQSRQKAQGSELILHIQNTFSDILTKLWDASQQSASVREASDIAAAARVEAMLTNSLHMHSVALNQSLEWLVNPVASRLNDAFEHHEVQVGRLGSLLDRTTLKWLDLGMGFSQMEGAFLRLFSNAEQVSIRLENAAQNIQSIRASQEETRAAASALTYAFVELTNATSFELGKLKLTLDDVDQKLRIRLHHDVHPWKHIVMKTLELVYRAEAGSLTHVEHLFSFKLVVTLLGFGWTALRAACSVAAALATLVFLGTRRAFVSKPIEDPRVHAALLRTSKLAPPDLTSQEAFVPMSAPTYPAYTVLPAARALYLFGSEGGAGDRQIASERRKRSSRIPDRLCTPTY